MCLDPAITSDGAMFGCRKCWQCQELRIQDWVGRCIAESKISQNTFSVTLTYGGGDHERAAVLTYSDVQKYFKRLRKAGYRFKYLVAGELGSMKGRAHWHMMLFFKGDAPPHELDKRFEEPFWHHGWSWWEKPHSKSVRYVCKYMQKDKEKDETQSHFMMSKKPPIGFDYFMRLADKQVEDGLSPQDLFYSFKENRDRNGKIVRHMMRGSMARDFLARFVSTWEAKRPGVDWPKSKLVDKFVHGLIPEYTGLLHEDRKFAAAPFWLPRMGLQTFWKEYHNTFAVRFDGEEWLWRLKQGEYLWQSETGRTALRSDPLTHELEIEAFIDQEERRQIEAEREWTPVPEMPPPPCDTPTLSHPRPKGRNLPMRGECWVPR